MSAPRPRTAAVGALAVIVVGFTVAIGSARIVEARTGAAVGVIDTYDRAAVASSYQRHVADNFDVSSRWTGAVNGCRPGAADAGFDAATIETVNWFRRMAGLPPVVEDPTASASAQRAALMMEAANALSHHPARDWPCYTASGASGAASSNLTLGIAGPRGVLGQIEDPGAGNDALGHRRWLLYPRLAEVGVGNTTRAGAVTVIGDFGTRPRGTPWVAWPPAGYVPASTVYDRWSLSFNNADQADFTRARVTMTENGSPVAVRMLPLVNGYGDATLGWEPVGITPARGTDVKYEVTVTGIVVGGAERSHRYDVVAFDSTDAGIQPAEIAGGEWQCLGRRATIVGTEASDTLVGTAGDDVIVARGGADLIDGGGGDDIICAGGGNDVVDGGLGADTILGGQGNDVLRGGPGDDVLTGQNGKDRLAGNQGNDLLVGGNHRDTMLGNTGSDTCWGVRIRESSTVNDNYRTCELGRR